MTDQECVTVRRNLLTANNNELVHQYDFESPMFSNLFTQNFWTPRINWEQIMQNEPPFNKREGKI